jgi:hypothetical protein
MMGHLGFAALLASAERGRSHLLVGPVAIPASGAVASSRNGHRRSGSLRDSRRGLPSRNKVKLGRSRGAKPITHSAERPLLSIKNASIRGVSCFPKRARLWLSGGGALLARPLDPAFPRAAARFALGEPLPLSRGKRRGGARNFAQLASARVREANLRLIPPGGRSRLEKEALSDARRRRQDDDAL